MTKKNLLIGSTLGVFFFFLSEFLTSKSSDLCFTVGTYSYETSCRLIGDLALIAFPILLISIFTLFFKRKEYFEAWKKFTFIYLFIYLFIALVTPWYAGDGFMNIQKEITIIALSVLYLILSSLLIIYKSWKLRGEK